MINQSGAGAGYQLVGRGIPSVKPAALCTPTIARSWNSVRSRAPA